MAGNVAEWVADTFAFDYYTYAPDHNPRGQRSLWTMGCAAVRGRRRLATPRPSCATPPTPPAPTRAVGFRCAQKLAGAMKQGCR